MRCSAFPEDKGGEAHEADDKRSNDFGSPPLRLRATCDGERLVVGQQIGISSGANTCRLTVRMQPNTAISSTTPGTSICQKRVTSKFLVPP